MMYTVLFNSSDIVIATKTLTGFEFSKSEIILGQLSDVNDRFPNLAMLVKVWLYFTKFMCKILDIRVTSLPKIQKLKNFATNKRVRIKCGKK